MRIRFLIHVFLLLLSGSKVLAEESVQARFGINLAEPKDWAREQPFLNVMKLSRKWISQSENSWDTQQPLALDKNGYVTRLEPGQWAATLVLTEVGTNFPGGRYVFLYDGKGKFVWKENAKLISSEPGRQIIEITPKERGFAHMIMTSVDPDDYPRNMRLVREEFEATFEDQPFDPELLKHWGNADTMRFMDWSLCNGSKQKDWNDRPVPEDRTYTEKGVALEEIIRLCNQIKVNPWVTIPHLADDEYIRNYASMLRDQLDPSLTVYFEFSNEVWNGMFAQARWANDQGLALNLDSAGWKAGLLFYATQCNRMFTILDEVYKDQPEGRYKKVVATQAGNIGVTRIILPYEDCAKNADVLAIAPYITFNVPEKKDQWNPGIPTASELEVWTVDQVFSYLNEKSLPASMRWMDEHMELAKRYDLDLVCYEGGQHLTALGEANKNTIVVSLMQAVNRDPRMGDVYKQYLEHWNSIGGRLFCLYNSLSANSPSGYWGLLEYAGQDETTAPKYMAVKEWAKSLPSYKKN